MFISDEECAIASDQRVATGRQAPNKKKKPGISVTMMAVTPSSVALTPFVVERTHLTSLTACQELLTSCKQ
jgi:hypothetical protein